MASLTAGRGAKSCQELAPSSMLAPAARVALAPSCWRCPVEKARWNLHLNSPSSVTARGMEQSCCAQCHPSWGWHTNMRILYLLSCLCLHQQCLSILPFYVSLVIQLVLLTVVHKALEFAKHACELLWSQGKVYLQNIICHFLNVFWRCTLICNRNGAESILKQLLPPSKCSLWLPTL